MCNHVSAACNGEQAAYTTLGYTEASWNNLSGEQLRPWSTIKSWAHLSAKEEEAAAVLGYDAITWDNESGNEPQPASFFKHWDELTTCDDGENACITPLL